MTMQISNTPDGLGGSIVIGGQERLVFEADGSVRAPFNARAWTDVTASRAIGTTYTNNSQFEIELYVVASSANANWRAWIESNGLSFFGSTALNIGNPTLVQVTIPAGATYRLNPSGLTSLSSWYELRKS